MQSLSSSKNTKEVMFLQLFGWQKEKSTNDVGMFWTVSKIFDGKADIWYL